MIRVEVVGSDRVAMKIRVAGQQLSGPLMRDLLGQSGEKGAGILAGYIPQRSGKTRQAVTYSLMGDEVDVGLGQTDPPGLGKWLFGGTKPHPITGSPLRFQSGGEDVYRPRVRHPGTKPIDVSAASVAAEQAVEYLLSGLVARLEPQLND
jgi:hypothetical protein